MALSVAVASVIAAGGVVFAAPRAANACTADTDGDCWRPNYQTWRTDGSLAVWTGPGIGGIESWLGGNGSQVEVICQATGKTEDGLPYTVWDQMDDGGWVYDCYITTPGDGYHPVLTLCDDSPPPQATNITATPTGTSTVHVNWQDNSDGTAQYLVGNGSVSRPVSPLPAGTTSYDWTGLGSNTTTCFNTLASNVFGNQGWSPSSCATTLPGVPGNVTATVLTAHTVKITWTAPAGGAASYVVGNGSTTSAALSSPATSYLWRGIPQSTNMCFTVRAQNAGGQSGWSSSACGTTFTAPFNDYVNIGDSLSSGEGTQNYNLDNTNTPANQCHRSTDSYSGQYLGLTSIYKAADNVACSGAVTEDFDNSCCTNGKNEMGVPDAGEGAQYFDLGPETDLVTLSFGINNIDFADILNTCYGSTTPYLPDPNTVNACFINQLTEPQAKYSNITLNAFIDEQEPVLQKLYGEIEAYAPNAQIVVVLYPLIYPRTFNGPSPSDANTGQCVEGPLGGAYVTSQEQLDAIYASENELDNVIRTAVAKVGGNIRVLNEENAFLNGGHDICAQEDSLGSPGPWANTIIMNGGTPGNDSFHPNTLGYGQIARDLRNLIGY